MKATIESYPVNVPASIFMRVLEVIIYSQNEDELIKKMIHLREQHPLIYGHYGYGSNHFWLSDFHTKNRILIVRF